MCFGLEAVISITSRVLMAEGLNCQFLFKLTGVESIVSTDSCGAIPASMFILQLS